MAYSDYIAELHKKGDADKAEEVTTTAMSYLQTDDERAAFQDRMVRFHKRL